MSTKCNLNFKILFKVLTKPVKYLGISLPEEKLQNITKK